MSRRLDIGVASYGAPDLLRRALDSIVRYSVTDWRVRIINNPHPERGYAAVKMGWHDSGPGSHPDRVTVFEPRENLGYAGAVNAILDWAETEYIAYLDHDVEIQTTGWDETFCSFLDRHHEAGMVFANGGAYPIDRGEYHEVMWSPGFAWAVNRLCVSEVGKFDEQIGHQGECDYALRARMAGWKCAALPQVRIDHLAKESNDPQSIERIAQGVREFTNKWVRYFCGKDFDYHSDRVLRWHDWHPNALYLEEYFKLRVPDLNRTPEPLVIDGTEYDLIRVPRLKGFYGSRII